MILTDIYNILTVLLILLMDMIFIIAFFWLVGLVLEWLGVDFKKMVRDELGIEDELEK